MNLDNQQFPDEEFCTKHCNYPPPPKTPAWRDISRWRSYRGLTNNPETQANQDKLIEQERRQYCETCLATLHEKYKQSKSHSS